MTTVAQTRLPPLQALVSLRANSNLPEDSGLISTPSRRWYIEIDGIPELMLTGFEIDRRHDVCPAFLWLRPNSDINEVPISTTSPRTNRIEPDVV